jgi:hypothetical protein
MHGLGTRRREVDNRKPPMDQSYASAYVTPSTATIRPAMIDERSHHIK